MHIRWLLAAGALTLSGSALAQTGPVVEQTSEDLICQLTRQCESLASDQPLARKGRQRKFELARMKQRRAAPAESAAPTAADVVLERPRVVKDSRRKGRPAPSLGRAAPASDTRPLSGTARALSGEARPSADLRVTFVTGSAELTPGGEREALKFVAALRDPRMAGRRFRIEGHTDVVGSAEYNLDLSRRRAQEVVEFLVGHGADRGLFEVTGFGFERLFDPAAPRAAANRRVEVVLAD